MSHAPHAPRTTGIERLRALTPDICQQAIKQKNPELCAVLTVLEEPRRAAAGLGGPLDGIPYVLKDVWDTPGIVTTGGSWRHRERIPSEPAHAVTALERTGAVLLGKSNLCDLAFSAESANHLMGPVKNPRDFSRTAGGSTGGGAAAVASGMAAFDWGTDFGGSIRSPAAFCGIVGMRLSNDAWPVEQHHFPRLPPLFWPFCGMGPLARTVLEAAAVTDALAPALRKPGFRTPEMRADEVVVYPPDEAHLGLWGTFENDAIALFRAIGVRAERARLPTPSKTNRLFNAYLASHFEDFIDGDELRLREGMPAVLLGLLARGRLDKRVHPNTGILLGLTAIGGMTIFRQKHRWSERLFRFQDAVAAVWKRGHFIATPTTTLLPPKHNRAAFARGIQSFTKFGNLVDATAIALPFGTFAGTPLSRSLQILGPPGSEGALLALAARVEAHLALHTS